MHIKPQLEEIIKTSDTLRPKSLIITIMGDVVAVHGGEIWSGDLVKLVCAFGITEESVRVSMQRLVEEGWLIKRKVKRLVYFRFSQMAQDIFNLNQIHIYQPNLTNWEGGWQMLLLLGDHDKKPNWSGFLRGLEWLGYRKLYKNFFLFPADEKKLISELINLHGLKDETIFFNAQANDYNEGKLIKKLVKDLWEIEELNQKFKNFIKKFSVFSNISHKQNYLLQPEALLLRLYLIHEFRRIILRSPRLPLALQYQHVVVEKLYLLTAEIYHALEKNSIEFIMSFLHSSAGKFTSATEVFKNRFRSLATPKETFALAKKRVINFSDKKVNTLTK